MDPKNVPTVKFNNGLTIPIIGLGTWQAPPDGSLYRSVRTAIECGYRHFDCAWVYENEEETGRAINDAIKDGLVKREELFLTSKVWVTYFKRDRVMQLVKKILDKFQTPYLDLCLVHWPVCFAQVDDTLFPTGADGKVIGGDTDFVECYQGLEDCLKAGLVKSIGVSNFTRAHIEKLLAATSVVPATNQVEAHPYLTQNKLKKFCEEKGITITSYSPLGNPGSNVNEEDKKKGCLLKEPVVLELAQKYGKNVGQILLKFQVQRGFVVVPKSVNPDRIKSNIQIFDFELTADDIKRLEGLDRNYRSNLFFPDKCGHLPYFPFAPDIEY